MNMRIDGPISSNPPNRGNRAIGENESETQRASHQDPSGATPTNSSHVPSKAVTQLLKQLEAYPEVRPQAVEQAVAKLASGEFLSDESARKLAQAIADQKM